MLKSSREKLPKNCPQLRGYPTHLRITCAVFSGWFGWSSGVPGRLRRVDRTQSDDQHLSLFDLNQGGYFHIIKCHFFWWRNIFPCEAKKGSDVSRSLSVALAWRCCKLLFGTSPWPNCQALNRTKHLFFFVLLELQVYFRNHFSGVAPCARLRKECNCCWSLPSWFGNPLDGIVECVGGTFRNSHLFHRTYD
jgi:hypothetical protein